MDGIRGKSIMAIDAATLGAAIRELRQLRRETQSGLAAAAKLAPNSIAVIERGERAVSLTSLNAIAKALDIPAGCLAILGTNRIAESPQSAAFVNSLKKVIMVTLKAEVAAKKIEKAAARNNSKRGPRKIVSNAAR
jgi:transcriptional regulator with XRE-family HTH domain